MDRSGACLTFAFPVDGQLPGFVTVLRFLKRDGAVDLANVELTYFDNPLPPRTGSRMDQLMPEPTAVQLAQMLADDFIEWVEMKAQAPVPRHVPPGGITVRRLRNIRIADYQTLARSYLRRPDTVRFMGTGWAEEATRRPGPGGKEDSHYARVAAAYVMACEEGSRPNEVLRQQFGFSVNTIRNQVLEARKRGLLTSPGQGRAGGELTAKARHLLTSEGI